MGMEPSSQQVELETKVAFLEHTVDALNDVILEHGRSIEALQAKLAQVTGRLAASDDGEGLPGPQDERPPHY